MEKKSGISRLSCGECDAVYIGQSGRSLKTRFAEHRTSFSTKKPADSAVAKHCLSTNHDYNKVSGKILHATPKSAVLDGLEEIETMAAVNLPLTY